MSTNVTNNSQNPFDRQAPIAGVKHILLVGSGKGGVGKSTVAANLAVALKDEGLRVGLLDADVYGPSLPRMFGALNQRLAISESGRLEPLVRHGLCLMSIGFVIDENKALVWRGPMLFKAIEQFLRDVAWGELDVLVIDLPPGTGDVALSLAQKAPVTGAVVVCTPQNIALVDAMKAVDMFEQVKVPVLGVVENMSYLEQPSADGKGTVRVQLFPKGNLDGYIETKGLKKLGQVAFEPRVGLSSEAGLPILVSEPESALSETFRNIARQLVPSLRNEKAPTL
jgi:ATP-binding protein involved in chromosome partitioning